MTNETGQGIFKLNSEGYDLERILFGVGDKLENLLAGLTYKHATEIKEAIIDLVEASLIGIEEDGEWVFTGGLKQFVWSNNSNSESEESKFWHYDMPVGISLEFNKIADIISDGVEILVKIDDRPTNPDHMDYRIKFLSDFVSESERLRNVLGESETKIRDLIGRLK